jgi:recombination protein RecA
MSKKKPDLEVVKEQATDSLVNLKEVARKFSSYMNTQYKEAVSYTPTTDTIAKVSVSKWLKMSPAFQDATGLEGLPLGNISMIFGKPNTGKTTILMEAIANAQKQNILPILILTEHKFDFSRLSNFMGADPEAMLVFHADNIEQAYGYIEKILRDLSVGKIVVEAEDGSDQVIDMSNQDCFIMMDSIGNTMSSSELEYEVEEHDKSMGKAAKAIKSLTRRVNQLLAKVRQKVGILFLNQSYQSMPSYGPSVETPYGGDGIPYSSVLILRLRRISDLKMTMGGKDVIIGLESKVEVKKNHISHTMPISSVYVVASGIMTPSKDNLDAYKKKYLK